MKTIRAIPIILLCLLFIAGKLPAASEDVAVTLMSKGVVEQKRGKSIWNSLKMGNLINDGDLIRTGGDGFASLVFLDDKSQLKVRPESEIVILAERDNDYNIAKKITVDVGQIFVDLTKPKGSFLVSTPTSVASVKGTEFWVLVAADGSSIILTLQGLVQLQSTITGLTVPVGAGQAGTVNKSGEIKITEITVEEIPTFVQPGEDENNNRIEIQFEDEEGNTKRIILELEEKQQQESGE